MRPNIIVVAAPGFNRAAGIKEATEPVFAQAFVPEAAIEASMNAFSTGFTGWMNCSPTPFSGTQASNTFQANRVR